MIDEHQHSELPILFGPKNGKHLKQLYPELATEPLFKDLSNEDVLFAWYIGNKSSPIDEDLEDFMRYRQAATLTFKTNEVKRKKYANKEITEDVSLAIKKMETYSPHARDLAKKALQNYFYNILKMSDVNVKKDFMYLDKEGTERIDFTARKQYIDGGKTASEVLPSLIKQVEEGFGIEKTKKEESRTRAIDTYHKNKKE